LLLKGGNLRGWNTLRAQFRSACDVSDFIGHTLDSGLNPSVFALNAAKRTRLTSHANKTRFYFGPPRQQPADFSSHFRRSSFQAYMCDRLFVDGSGYLHIGFATISFLSRVILSLCKHVKPWLYDPFLYLPPWILKILHKNKSMLFYSDSNLWTD